MRKLKRPKKSWLLLCAALVLLWGGLIGQVKAAALSLGADELISASPAGYAGNYHSLGGAAMTPDGRYVGFVSDATNLVPGIDPASIADRYYVYDRLQHVMELVSQTTDGQQLRASTSVPPMISSDGRYVAFIASPAGTSNINVYIRDQQTQTTKQVSATSQSPSFSNGNSLPSLSNNGSVVYTGFDNSTNTSGTFIYDATTDQTTFKPMFFWSQISADGNSVYGINSSANVVSKYDIATDTTTQIIDSGSTTFAWFLMSPDQQHLAYKFEGQDLYLRDLQNGQDTLIASAQPDVIPTSISANNRFVSYLNRVPVPYYVGIKDMATGDTLQIPIERGDGRTQLNADGSEFAYIPLSDRQVHVSKLLSQSLDSQPPVITNTAFSTNPKSVNTTPVTLTATATDASGIASAEYFDPASQTWQPMSVNGSSLSATVNTPASAYPAGIYTFKVRATDAAGNTSTPVNVNLDVYDPSGKSAAGHGFIAPNGATSDVGDSLPAMPGPNVRATLDFSVKYPTTTSTQPVGSNVFTWGSNCNSPQSNCFRVSSSSLQWLVVPPSSSSAVFQGIASVTQGNGTTSTNPFRVTVTRGSASHYLLQVFAVGADPDNSQPLYQASGDLTGGQIILLP